MSTLRFGLFVLAAIGCLGCHSPTDEAKSSVSPDMVIFREPEIRSRLWTEPNGHFCKLLDWSMLNIAQRGKLLVARYGDPAAHSATCVDFYRVASKAETDGKEEMLFILLAHDNGWGVVTSVEPEENDGHTYIRIIRESYPGAVKRQRLIQWLEYLSDYSMFFTPRSQFYDVPASYDPLLRPASTGVKPY